MTICVLDEEDTQLPKLKCQCAIHYLPNFVKDFL